jgi:nucleoside-diphosphate-sugar epimerase
LPKTLLLTGADGFLGTHLTSEFTRQGWTVYGLVRNCREKRLPPGLAGCFEYSLASGAAEEALRIRADMVIHAAFQTRGAADAESGPTNLRSTTMLIEQFQRAHFIFISSMSAHDDALSHYGRSKRQIERAIDLDECLAIRPGFVIGPGGIFQRLAQTLSRTRIAPMPYGGSLPIQTADVEELARAIEQLASVRATGLCNFGEVTPVSIATFYRSVVEWMGKRISLFPVPGAPILLLARLMEQCGVPLPLTSENLLGLKGLIHQPVEPTVAKIGWQPSSLSEILNRYDPRTIVG